MPKAQICNSRAPFQLLLIGTWSNQTLPNATNGEGSQQNPLSYNVMPLPQKTPQSPTQDTKYILKNFTLYETVQFYSNTEIPPNTTAPNRAADSLQLPTAVYYGQQVMFAEGPDKDSIVHTENGAWLHMTRGQKLVGPYDEPAVDPNTQPPQPADITIAKQMSIPHGISVLALGSYCAPTAGAPTIPDAASIFPSPSGILDTTPYITTLDASDNYQNPQPTLTQNVNKPLQEAIALIQPTHYISWSVTTKKLPSGKGDTMNIPFETTNTDVSAYSAEYWLLSVDGGVKYNILAYSQNITLKVTIRGQTVDFPHITSNVVTRQ
jgi:hypothetical protein